MARVTTIMRVADAALRNFGFLIAGPVSMTSIRWLLGLQFDAASPRDLESPVFRSSRSYKRARAATANWRNDRPPATKRHHLTQSGICAEWRVPWPQPSCGQSTGSGLALLRRTMSRTRAAVG